MPANKLVTAPRIVVNGGELRPAHYESLVDLRVSQSVSMPSQLTMRMSDPGFTLIDGTLLDIGAEVVVSFPDPAGVLVTVFDGEIVTLGADQNAERADACEIVVTAYDRAHRLGYTTRVRTFQRQSYADVVRQIAGEEGLPADVQSTAITFDYLMQTTTNYAFLNELAFRTGFEWSVEGRTLKFRQRADSPPVTVTYGEDIRRLKARFSAADAAKDVMVRSWDPSSKRATVGRAALSKVHADPAHAGTAALGSGGRRKALMFGGNLGTPSLIATNQAEADQLANALSTRVGSADLSARCTCNGRSDVMAGHTVEIKGAGTKLSGHYYVISVEHTFGRNADMTTTFTTGGIEPSSIVDLLGGGNERIEGFGQAGLTVGLVTNNKDPDGLGRVRVKFPALSDAEESWWARVVTPGASSDAGLMFMPQIDDEVLVGFEHGDLRRPFVLGGLWGQKARPPTPTSRFLANNRVIDWGLKTAAGHSMTIRGGDQPADKHFEVALADGTLLYLGADKTEVIAQNKSIELKSGQGSVLITERGDIQLRGVNITIEATQALKFNGLTIDAKAKTTLTADGAATIALKGGGSAKLEATGITELKGSMVKIN